MPAFWAPLKGVTIGEVAPGSQPRLNGTLELLNHRPRWYWWVGANVVVPPGETEKVSESNTPRTVAVPVPVLPAWMSVWYHDTPTAPVVARAASLAGAEASRRRVGFMRSLLSAAAPEQRHRRSPVRAAAK